MASNSSQTDDTKARSPIKRIRISLNVIVQITLVVVIVSAANFLSCQNYRQWDRSATQQFTISQQSRNILGALTKDVKITVAFDRDSDLYDYVTTMVALYEKEAKGRISVRVFDPKRDPSVASELRAKDSNLTFNENMLIVEVEGQVKRFIREQEIVQREDNTPLRSNIDYRGRIIAYRLENPLTSAILAVTENRRQIVYIIADKGAFRRVDDGVNTGDAYGLLLVMGEQFQNMELRPLAIGGTRSIPQDASAVICINPSSDFTQPELDTLFKDYWDRRKGGLVFLLNPDHRNKILGLVSHLTTYHGIRFENDRILTTESRGGRNAKVFDVPVNFVNMDVEPSPIVEDLLSTNVVLKGATSRLRILENDPTTLAGEDFRYSVLAVARSGYWAERDYLQENVLMDPREQLDLFVAVSAEKGAGRDARLRATVDSARMVVVGNASLLDPDRYTPETFEFVMNSLNWVSDRDELVGGIESRKAGVYRINIQEDEYSKLEWLTIKILPASVFLLGCFVMFFRRH